MRKQKIATVHKACVACGNCVKYCRLAAITVYKGLQAKVDEGRCVGCGKCAEACPAGVITCVSREGVHA